MKSCMLWFKGEGNAQQGCEPELFLVFVCFWGVFKGETKISEIKSTVKGRVYSFIKEKNCDVQLKLRHH